MSPLSTQPLCEDNLSHNRDNITGRLVFLFILTAINLIFIFQLLPVKTGWHVFSFILLGCIVFELFVITIMKSYANSFIGHKFLYLWEIGLLSFLLLLAEKGHASLSFLWFLWLFIPLQSPSQLKEVGERAVLAVICDGIISFYPFFTGTASKTSIWFQVAFLLRAISYLLLSWVVNRLIYAESSLIPEQQSFQNLRPLHCRDPIAVTPLPGPLASGFRSKELSVSNLSRELTKTQEISRHSVEALEKTREDLSLKVRELSTLHEAMAQISSTLDLHIVIQLVVNRSKEELDSEAAFLMLVDGNTLRLEKSEGLSELTFQNLTGDIAITPLGVTVREKKSIRLERSQNEKLFTGFLGTKEPIKSILAVPLLSPTSVKPVGVLGVINALRSSGFTKEHEEFLITLAGQAAVALTNAQLYQDLRKAQMGTIMRLSIVAEFKDKHTASHLKRISNYSAVIAKKIGLSEEQVELIYLASPMHDIGKIGISDSILLKPGKLTPEEFEEIKKHPVIGGAIFEGADTILLQVSQQIALCHHEKYDGTGYPNGLAGDKIPLAARIVAVADVFDALTSERPYKPAFPVDEAVKYLKDLRSKHFDPIVLDAFFAELPKITMIYNNEKDSMEHVSGRQLNIGSIEKEGWTLRY